MDCCDGGTHRDDGPALRVSRRYWGDEMSSCIEIYCLHLLNSDDYLPCLQNYCPDAVVAVMPKRQLPGDEPSPVDMTLGLGEVQRKVQGQLVTCPGRRGSSSARKHCVGFVCHEVVSGVMSLDMATSRCVLLRCAGDETDYQRCVIDLCC